MLDRFVSKDFQRYYLALLACVLLIDYGVLPLVPFVSYSSLWYLTGITINGQPLFLLLEYPFALAFWLSVIRLVQIRTGWLWRTAYYAGFMIFAVVEEAFNEYVVTLYHYAPWVNWSGQFYFDLIPRILLGWVLYILVADLSVQIWHRWRRIGRASSRVA